MKSGGKLARYTGLQRFGRLPQVRAELRRRPEVVRDPSYLDRVRALPCAARGMYRHACTPVIHAHHAGPRGLGQKPADSTAIPLCSLAHTCWHDAKGCFFEWTKAERAAWAADKIAETRKTLGWSEP